MKKSYIIIAMLSMFTISFYSCRERTTGEKVEEAVESVGEDIEETAEDVEEEIDEEN